MNGDTPSDSSCDVANPTLWAEFSQLYYNLWKVQPNLPWTEAEVVQWIDMKQARNPEITPYGAVD